MEAFSRAVEARVRRSAHGAERGARAAWKTCAIAADKAGAAAVAAACRARAVCDYADPVIE